MWRDFYPEFILSKVKSREDIKVAKEGRRSATKATEIIVDNKRCKSNRFSADLDTKLLYQN